MISTLDRLAVLIVCLLPTTLPAQTVVFRNECKTPVVVQTSTVFRNTLVRDSPYPLRSMEATPRIALSVNKILTVYDPKSNQVLYRDVLRATRMDLAYGIVLDPPPPGRVRVVSRRPESIKPGKPSSGMTNPGKPNAGKPNSGKPKGDR
jgi:hypothetical protein